MGQGTGLQLVTPVQARQLKKLGFPKECASEEITVELAAKWLREKMKLWIETSYCHYSMPPNYVSTVFGYSLRPYRQGFVGRSGYHKDYEGALSEGIDIALKTLTDDRKTQRKEQAQYQSVDLGLPSGLKWADRNVGAASPEAYGGYFMWGSTESDTQKRCHWDAAPFNGCSSDFNSPYFNAHKSEWLTDEGVLKPEFDAAHVIMGGNWRTPTPAEMQELLDWTAQTVEEPNGVKGMRFTAPNGSSVFMPFAGIRYGSDVYYTGYCGFAWSSSLNAGYANGLHGLDFGYGGKACVNDYDRCLGFVIRGVC